MRRILVLSVLVGGLAFALAGCGDKLDPFLAGPGDNGSPEAVTYTEDIKPILDANCILCHASDKQGAARNGAPPDVNLDTYEGVVAVADRANARIQAGTMPPGTGGLPAEDRALYQDWIDQGTPR